MGVEEDILNRISKRISEEIDNEVMITMLRQVGWQIIHTGITENQVMEVQSWIKDNCVGNYHGYIKTWVFENPQDAFLFKLKWL
jgi:hypothetical protein